MTPPQVQALRALIQQYWPHACAAVLPQYTDDRLSELWSDLVFKGLTAYGVTEERPPTLPHLLAACLIVVAIQGEALTRGLAQCTDPTTEENLCPHAT